MAFHDQRQNIWRNFEGFDAPKGTEIVSVREKLGVFGRFIILLDNGNAYQFDVTSTRMSPVTSLARPPASEQYTQVAGDALYLVTASGRVFVSRDHGSSWQIDTVGLHGSLVSSVVLDSAQYVYAATSKGLYKQHPDSSAWKRMDSLYTLSFGQRSYPSIYSVLVDRRNVMYANVAYSGTWVSRNGGTLWTFDTVGIGNRPINSFATDAWNTTYAITSGNDNRIYRTSDSGRSWIRIDQSLTGLKLDPNAQYPFQGICADSAVGLLTQYASYISTDQGNTWQELPNIVPSATFHDYLRTGGKTIITTYRGIFIIGPADSSWKKSFPTSGFLGGLKPYVDASGTLYTRGEAVNTTSPPKFYRSTDVGTSWSLDTSGNFTLRRPGYYFVDHGGVQHFVAPEPGSNGVKVYTKPPSGTWTRDTSGFRSTLSTDVAYAMHLDRTGYLYLAGKISGGGMWRRPSSGGTWTLDTAGLGTRIPEFLTIDKNGNLLAIVAVEYPNYAIYRRSSGIWTRLPHPTGAPSASRISVDSSNAIWASMYNDPFGDRGAFEVDNRGVYVTTNSGTTWTKVGVDSTVILGLVSYGDTTYALTNGRGMYAMTKSGVLSGIERPAINSPEGFGLSQNYPNPFNPETVLEYRIPVAGSQSPDRSVVQLSVFDLLGREVAVLVKGEMAPGQYRATWNAAGMPSGVYFARLSAGSLIQTKRIMLLK